MNLSNFQILFLLFRLSVGKKQQNNRSLGNDIRLLANPVSAYLLIKRLIEEWNNIKRLTGSDIGEELLREISELRATNYVKNPTTVLFLIN